MASLTVIASEAKQSIYRLAQSWIASSLSLLAMTGGDHIAPPFTPAQPGLFRSAP
jgi:hypothetical protein